MDGRAERLASTNGECKDRNVVLWLPVIIATLLSIPFWLPTLIEYWTGVETYWWLIACIYLFGLSGGGLAVAFLGNKLMNLPWYRKLFRVKNMRGDDA